MIFKYVNCHYYYRLWPLIFKQDVANAGKGELDAFPLVTQTERGTNETAYI